MACGPDCCAPPPPQRQDTTVRPAEQVSDILQERSSVVANVDEQVILDVKRKEATDECCAGDDDAADQDSCKDGCCGNKQLTISAATANPTCDDGCCAKTEENALSKGLTQEKTADIGDGDGCCADEKAETSKADACCNDDGGCCATKDVIVEPSDEVCKDACCGGEKQVPTAPVEEPNAGCRDACCDNGKPSIKDAEAPPCCEGKPSPCCDVSCLDRLAGRECEDQHTTESPYAIECCGGGDDTEGKGQDRKPCEEHKRSVREKYAAKLEALGCLCRALVALGQESCCHPSRRSSLERRKRCTKVKDSRKSVDSCCATGVSRRSSSSVTSVRAWGSRVTECGGGDGVGRAMKKDDGCSKGCCAPACDVTGCASVDSCCAEKGKGGTNVKEKAVTDSPPINLAPSRDLENGLSGKEHVILSISGMTCTGCETKLKRTLANLTSVKNLKTSLVLSRAEFDLDLRTGTVAEVMKHLERTTEFKCEKIFNQGANIDIIPPCDAQEFVNRDWPLGVLDVSVVNRNLVKIAFDAKAVGARDLIDKGWDYPLTLAPPQADPTVSAGSKHVRNVGWMTILSAILTIPVLVLAWAPLPGREIAYGSASLALASLVQVIIAGPFYPKALKALVFSRVIEMDLLIVLSTSAAYIFSVVSFGYLVAGHPLSTGEFFETSTLLVTLIMVGRYVAALARQKAVESISVRSLQAATAILVDDAGEKEIDTRLLQYGDIFKVLPDSKIPTDGTVISGSSEVDESMITGESRPVEKYVKSSVIAGSVNGAGTLTVRLDRLPRENTISAIANMVDEAKLSKPVLQDLADRVASYFVPVVVTLTIITFCAWVGVGIAAQGKSGSEAVIQAITYAITVLIVSCPCAIGLAVPMVVVIVSGVAAEKGAVIKDATTIEVARKTSHVVLDKTGTLTEGRLTVASQVNIDAEWIQEKVQPLLLTLLADNKHPVSAAVAAQLREKGVMPSSSVSEVKVLTGKGVEATTKSGLILRAGNSRWLNFSEHPRVQSTLSKGYTTFCFTIDSSLIAVFGLEDSLRPDALTTVSQLHKRGVAVHVISGDDDAAVRAVTNRLGISDEHVRSRCTPADKQAYIQALQQPPPSRHGKAKSPTVLFCGDGTNDAVALAQATIGVHVNDSSGTDVAKSAADVVLMRPSLEGILTLMNISDKAIGRIGFNFGWSFVYNTFAVLLGGGAFASLGGVRIPPEFAGLGELVSVLPVVVAAVLLRWEKAQG